MLGMVCAVSLLIRHWRSIEAHGAPEAATLEQDKALDPARVPLLPEVAIVLT